MRFRGTAYLLLALATLCWSGNFIVGRAVASEIPPFSLNFWRWALAGAIFLPFTARAVWAHRAIILRHWRVVSVLAITGIGAFHSFIYLALSSTTAINAALFMATIPVVIPVLSFLLDRQAISARQTIGLVVSLAGVVAIVSRADPQALAALRFNPGDLWMLAAVPLWSLYSVLLRRRPAALPPMVLLAAIMAIGIMLLLPVYLWELSTVGGFAVTARNLLSLGYLALFTSVIAYIAWNRGVEQVGANKAGLFMHLIPVFATGMGIVLLGETLETYHLLGIALIGVGILLTTAGSAATPETPRSPGGGG